MRQILTRQNLRPASERKNLKTEKSRDEHATFWFVFFVFVNWYCDGLPAKVWQSSEEPARRNMLLTELMVGPEQHINYWQHFFGKVYLVAGITHWIYDLFLLRKTMHQLWVFSPKTYNGKEWHMDSWNVFSERAKLLNSRTQHIDRQKGETFDTTLNIWWYWSQLEGFSNSWSDRWE